MKTKNKLIILQIARVVGVLAPLAILVALNSKTWLNFQTKTGYTVTAGLFLSMIVAILWLLKLMKGVNGLVWMVIFAIIFTLLEPIMKDIKMIAWACVVSAAINYFLSFPIKTLQETRGYEKQATIQATAMESVISKGSGRA